MQVVLALACRWKIKETTTVKICSRYWWRHWNCLPTNIYLFSFNNEITRKWCEICSKLTIKTPERRHCRHSGVSTVNFEHLSHLFLAYLLFTMDRKNICWTSGYLLKVTSKNTRFKYRIFPRIYFKLTVNFSIALGLHCQFWTHWSSGIYLFKVNNGNFKIMSEICSMIRIKTPGRRLWHRSGVFFVNFEQVLHSGLVFSLWTLDK